MTEQRQAPGETPQGPPRRRRKRRRLHVSRPPSVSAGAVKSEINVTPLVDVVLVLLILFMVVTPMLTRGAKVELPETAHHEKRQDNGDQIIVSVTNDHRVYVDADLVGLDGLPAALRKSLAKKTGEGGPRPVHVKADKRLDYGEVREVLERIHEAGAPSAALGTTDHGDQAHVGATP